MHGSSGIPRPVMNSRHALLISTASYQDEALRELNSPTPDSQILEQVLADPAIGAFETQAIFDRPYFEICERVGDFLADRRRDDTILIYITGHGLKNPEGELYFAATNTRQARLEETGVSAERLARQMERCRARRILLILDCCFGGAFPAGFSPKSAESIQFDEFDAAGTIVLTATSATEFAFEGSALTAREFSSSVFTEAVVLGLTTGDADIDRDGKVSATDLFGYVTAAFRDLRPKQSPTLHAHGMQGDYFISGTPVATRTAQLPRARDINGGLESAQKTAESENGPPPRVLGDILEDVLNQIEVAAGRDVGHTGGSTLSTGHERLDSLTGGIGAGDLVLITGASGAGKSTLAMDFLRESAIRAKRWSIFATLEASQTDATMRILSAEAGIQHANLRAGWLGDDDWRRLARIMGGIAESPIVFLEQETLSLSLLAQEIRSTPRSELVVVDSLQLLAESGDPPDLLSALRTLKLLAKQENVVIAATVSPDPRLANGSSPIGEIDRYADLVINVFRHEQVEDWSSRMGEADLILIKNRRGPRGTVTVAFQPHYARFVDLTNEGGTFPE